MARHASPLQTELENSYASCQQAAPWAILRVVNCPQERTPTLPEFVRTHVLLPRDLIEGVDEIVGPRHRSEFIAEALEEKLAHSRLRAAMREAAGSLNLADYPEWSTPEKVSAWVHDLRQLDNPGVSEILRERAPE